MMDLIDRGAAIEAIDHEREILLNQGRDGAEHVVVHHARRLIEDMPTVPAVPLDKLCEWLAGYADPPKYAMVIIPKSGECLINARAKAWEHHFRSMMECGLMEEADGPGVDAARDAEPFDTATR